MELFNLGLWFPQFLLQVRNDFLNLRVPIWVSSLEFLRNDANKVVVGSGHHSIRLYDRRDKRRPVIDTDWHEHPITALAVKKGNSAVLVGNSAGYMGEIDLRTGKQVGGFKGNSGSIRSIACHPTQPLGVSGGLDRFLKVYDLISRKLVKKVSFVIVFIYFWNNGVLLEEFEINLFCKSVKGNYLRETHVLREGRMDANYCFSCNLLFLSVACNECEKIIFVFVHKGLVRCEKMLIFFDRSLFVFTLLFRCGMR